MQDVLTRLAQALQFAITGWCLFLKRGIQNFNLKPIFCRLVDSQTRCQWFAQRDSRAAEKDGGGNARKGDATAPAGDGHFLGAGEHNQTMQTLISSARAVKVLWIGRGVALLFDSL